MQPITLTVTWAKSRGEYTKGQNICRIDDGRKRYRHTAEGFDHIPIALGKWLTARFYQRIYEMYSSASWGFGGCMLAARTSDETLTPKEFVSKLVNRYDSRYNVTRVIDGSKGMEHLHEMAEAIGLYFEWFGDCKGNTAGYTVRETPGAFAHLELTNQPAVPVVVSYA